MDDVPPRSYGQVIETTLRIVTWNVWGLYSDWQEREEAIVATLRDARPDIVVLTESWSKGDDRQCGRLADPLQLPHHTFSGVAAQEDEAALSGVAVMSRWPIRRQSSLSLGGARVRFAELAHPPRAIPGPTTIRRRNNFCGPAVESITSSLPRDGRAAQATRRLPPCWGPVRSRTSTLRTTTPCGPTFATDRGGSADWPRA